MSQNQTKKTLKDKNLSKSPQKISHSHKNQKKVSSHEFAKKRKRLHFKDYSLSQKNLFEDKIKAKIQSKKNEDVNVVEKKQKKRSLSQRWLETGIKEKTYSEMLETQIKDLTERQSKLCSSIEIYNLLQSNGHKLRCMSHNNTLALYCLTERRVLCVNCVYGTARHRTHKLIPLKDSMEFIREDNTLLQQIITQDLRILDVGISSAQFNILQLDKQMKATLSSLEATYKKGIDEVTATYQKNREKVQQYFAELLRSSTKLNNIMEQFKFKAWETLSKIGIGRRQEAANNDQQIIAQVFCVTLTDLLRVKVHDISLKQLHKISKHIGIIS